MKVKNLILGAGIAGIAAANQLDKNNTVVCEAMPYVGGLCHSFCVNGFWFDTAVHLSFTGISDVRAVFDKTEYLSHLPVAYNFYKGHWLKHPVINNLCNLSADEKTACILGLINRNTESEINSYSDWLKASYGETLYKNFYEVYTKKYWTVSSEKMSCTWIGSRLSPLNWEKVLNGAFTLDTGIDYYAKEMRYPAQGRYEAFFAGLINNCNIRLNKRAVEINTESKIVYFEDGEKTEYENLICTLPLPKIIKMLDNVPDEISAASENLNASSISLVSVGFKRPDVARYLWMYVYDEDIWAARINSPSKKSPANAPENCSSLQFEIYHNPNKPIPKREKIIENVKYSISKMQIADEKDILFMDYRFVPYGNVIFYNGMENDRENVRRFVKSQGIRLAGRFGEWDYLWSDQSFMSGKNAAISIL